MQFHHRSFVPALAVATLFCLAAHPAHAQTVTNSNNVIVLTPAPTNVTQGMIEDNTNATAFMENQNLVLTAPLSVDISTPGTYTTKKSLTSGTINAGTDVNSFMFYTDPVGKKANVFTGSITFTNQVLGLEVLSNSLDSTDSLLGLSTTIYPTGVASRGLEFATDDITLNVVDAHTINWTYKTSGSVDEVRVLTAAVPEPTAALPMGLMLLTSLMLWRRRPAHAGQSA